MTWWSCTCHRLSSSLSHQMQSMTSHDSQSLEDIRPAVSSICCLVHLLYHPPAVSPTCCIMQLVFQTPVVSSTYCLTHLLCHPPVFLPIYCPTHLFHHPSVVAPPCCITHLWSHPLIVSPIYYLTDYQPAVSTLVLPTCCLWLGFSSSIRLFPDSRRSSTIVLRLAKCSTCLLISVARTLVVTQTHTQTHIRWANK